VKPVVELVALTTPTTDMLPLEFIAFVARVSNPENQDNHGTAERLLGYMSRNNHWSPFEMAHMVMYIETTRDIARQILRHRSFSFQEFSQRYSKVADTYQVREARLQDTKNRQGSLENDDEALGNWWTRKQRDVAAFASSIYNQALELGVAKEVARAVLPEGMTPSRMYMAGSVRSWIHYVQLRCEPGTQKEHREIAEKCRDVLLATYPVLLEVLYAEESRD